MAPRVSVNLCCYNGERYLDAALQSIGSQTYKDWELVVVDDGSSDSSARIIRRYIDQGWPIRYHFQQNAGLANARNKCLELSSGEFFAFIDQDDLWPPEKLERQVPLFDANPKVGLVYADVLNFYEGTSRSFRHFKRISPVRGRIFGEQLKVYNIGLGAAMIRREALQALGQAFDPELRLAEDADLFLRILYRYEGDFVPDVGLQCRIHEENTSRRWVKDWPREQEYILAKFIREFPGFEEKYADEIDAYRAKVGLRRAISAMDQGDKAGARKALSPYLRQDWRYRAVYLVTYLPAQAYHYLHFLYRR